MAAAATVVAALGVGIGVSTWPRQPLASAGATPDDRRAEIEPVQPEPESRFVSADGSYVLDGDAAISTTGPITRDS